MSMRNLVSHVSTPKASPQSEPIPGREAEMVQNEAGGYVFKLDGWERLMRFLILGTTGGTYYATEKALTAENAREVLDLVKADGLRVVRTVVEVSDAGRAPKNDPAILVLAMAAKLGDDATRAAAHAAVPKVCRIGTHLFQFAEAVKAFGGFGRATRRAISDWYYQPESTRDGRWLALQAIKYQQREGWSHRDLLRLVKPGSADRRRTSDPATEAVLRWIAKGTLIDGAPALLHAFVEAQALGNEGGVTPERVARMVRLIADHGLPREAVPSQYLNEVAIWAALLDNQGYGMPLTALIRNLGKMTSIGLIAPMSDAADRVVGQLGDAEALCKARVHPLTLLVALKTYQSGAGVRGALSWSPVSQIVDALDGAFYSSFGAVETTGKRHFLAVDVSGSMSWSNIAGMPITPAVAAAAMSMITAAREPQHVVTAFSTELTEVKGISPRMRLDGVIKGFSQIPMGGTDCSAPMRSALAHKVPVDVFVIYTDNATWAGDIQPIQALDRYRQSMGIDAKLITVGMTATEGSIGDQARPDCMDVVGFDTAAPSLMAEFTMGRL